MTKEEILKSEYSKLIANPEKLYVQNPSIIQAAHTAMDEYAKQLAVAFSKWKEKLTPVQRCTVWPPVGSGSGTGLYEQSDGDLYDKFLQSL